MRISDWSSDVCSSDLRCEAVPTPYTGALQFRSKYEGSDKARATLNVKSEKAFRDATSDITRIERGVRKQVMQFMRDGRPRSEERRVGKECVSPCRSRGSP